MIDNNSMKKVLFSKDTKSEGHTPPPERTGSLEDVRQKLLREQQIEKDRQARQQ